MGIFKITEVKSVNDTGCLKHSMCEMFSLVSYLYTK